MLRSHWTKGEPGEKAIALAMSICYEQIRKAAVNFKKLLANWLEEGPEYI
jgi:hypothetical protein